MRLKARVPCPLSPVPGFHSSLTPSSKPGDAAAVGPGAGSRPALAFSLFFFIFFCSPLTQRTSLSKKKKCPRVPPATVGLGTSPMPGSAHALYHGDRITPSRAPIPGIGGDTQHPAGMPALAKGGS